MSTELSASFNEQYNNINTKLKKRFMRKPNVSEATNEFIGLAIKCEHSEQPTFAGHVYIGAAKCEASVGNSLGEAEHYMNAARQFMKAEKRLIALKFDSPDRENLEAGIGCFLQALHKYPEKSPLRTAIFMEIANDLLELDYKLEAIAYYEQALDTVEDDDPMRLMYLHKFFNMQIDAGKYDLALKTGNNIVDLKCHIPERLLEEIQVSRVLLALIVELEDEHRTESLKMLFQDILNDENNDSIPFCPNLMLKLQSIIISSTMADQQSLINILADTKVYLTSQQIDLLETLIEKKQQQ